MRTLPPVSFWRMDRDGSVIVTRTDVPGHREELEAFIVESAFREEGVDFEPGDLVQYLRFLNDMPLRFAIGFQHLRKLEQEPSGTTQGESEASPALFPHFLPQRGQ
jgi:hypothetical protein